MINTGLVSVTFRELDPEAIIDLVAQAELDAIEWGGDVHVPHGDVRRARTVRAMTADAGLRTPSYGSYYRAGHTGDVAFSAIVDTAIALGASVIRIWAGRQGSAEADEAYRQRVVADSRRVADLAGEAGLSVAYEFHNNTLTDTYDSACSLLQRVDCANVKVYWQPPVGLSIEENLAGLERILRWLANVHVQSTHVVAGEPHRAPLSANADAWQRYLEKIASIAGDHFAMLEFVQGDTPEQFLEDAAVLKTWVAPYAPDLPVTV